ncbi:MAG TPA: hypothetical protein GXZ27_03020 [Thermoanaerobacterales bacterium]|jgi:hypothetical protein|nr:hypothetical protein [Thermoanaerobacterales bacterium]
MTYTSKKLFIIISLLLFLTVGLLVYKNHYNNRIPKSAKLVLLLKE